MVVAIFRKKLVGVILNKVIQKGRNRKKIVISQHSNIFIYHAYLDIVNMTYDIYKKVREVQ